MMKHRTTTPSGLWNRAAQALGKLWAGVVSLPDDRRQTARQNAAADAYPRFPIF